MEAKWEACTSTIAGTDTFCKMPGTCHYLRDRDFKIDFEFTIYDEGGTEYQIQMDGDDMLVDGTDIQASYTNSCYIPLIK